MAEIIATTFVMYGAREAMAAGLTHIEEQIKAIERAVVENPGLAFDLAKTLIESACKAILSEKQTEFTESDDLPRLFKAAIQILPLLPPAANSEAEGRKSLVQTLSGLSTTVQGICELRNSYGFASHGSGSPRPLMGELQAILAAQAADTIVGFLYRAHRQPSGAVVLRLEYGDHPEFDAYVDEANARIRIFNLEYTPSEVLFQVDQEAYRDLLADYSPDGESAIEDAASASAEAVA